MTILNRLWGFIKGWKTVALGVIIGVLPLLEALQVVDLAVFFKPEIRPYVGAILGALIVLFRWLTTTPVFKNVEPNS